MKRITKSEKIVSGIYLLRDKTTNKFSYVCRFEVPSDDSNDMFIYDLYTCRSRNWHDYNKDKKQFSNKLCYLYNFVLYSCNEEEVKKLIFTQSL